MRDKPKAIWFYNIHRWWMVSVLKHEVDDYIEMYTPFNQIKISKVYEADFDKRWCDVPQTRINISGLLAFIMYPIIKLNTIIGDYMWRYNNGK